MLRFAGTGTVIILCAPIIAITACIIKEDCVYTPKVGHPWKVTLTAQVKKNGVDDIVTGMADECFSDDDHALLSADDPNDQQNAALRNQLLANAQVDCVKKAKGPTFTEVRCNPFVANFDGIVQFRPLEGTCLQALSKGQKGTPIKKNAECPNLPADSEGGSSGGQTTTGRPRACRPPERTRRTRLGRGLAGR